MHEAMTCNFVAILHKEEGEKFKMKIYVSSGIRTNARHSATGKSALKTARSRRLDDDLWFNVLQDSGIQIKIIT